MKRKPGASPGIRVLAVTMTVVLPLTALAAPALDKQGKVVPPPRPAVATVVVPGEPPEQLKRNRHGWNEKKLEKLLADKKAKDKAAKVKDTGPTDNPSRGAQ